jgi:hypothetical protein
MMRRIDLTVLMAVNSRWWTERTLPASTRSTMNWKILKTITLEQTLWMAHFSKAWTLKWWLCRRTASTGFITMGLNHALRDTRSTFITKWPWERKKLKSVEINPKYQLSLRKWLDICPRDLKSQMSFSCTLCSGRNWEMKRLSLRGKTRQINWSRPSIRVNQRP